MACSFPIIRYPSIAVRSALPKGVWDGKSLNLRIQVSLRAVHTECCNKAAMSVFCMVSFVGQLKP